MFTVDDAAQQSYTREKPHQPESEGHSGLWSWSWHQSGPEGLQHPLPLGEDGMSGPGPAARAPQTVLVRSAGSQEHLQGQMGVLDQQVQDVWSHPHQVCQGVQVGDAVHLERVPL